jgi:hypothetical protein
VFYSTIVPLLLDAVAVHNGAYFSAETPARKYSVKCLTKTVTLSLGQYKDLKNYLYNVRFRMDNEPFEKYTGP